MNLLWEIGLQAVEILTLVFGILGMTLSLMLLFAPRATQNVSNLFNRSLDIDRKLGFLDRDISTENFVYSHSMPIGVLLVAGSAFAFLFFLFKFDVALFNLVFFGVRGHSVFGEILFQTIAWIGRVACLFGLLAGLSLVLAPRRLRAIERRMNRWIETRVLFEKVNRPLRSLDTVFFRYPIFFGLLGGSISCVLIVLSILNLLH